MSLTEQHLVTSICGSASTAYQPAFFSWSQRRMRSTLATLANAHTIFCTPHRHREGGDDL